MNAFPKKDAVDLRISMIILVTLMISACSGENRNAKTKPNAGPEASLPTPAITSVRELFLDCSNSAGINFKYQNGEESNHLSILESLGGGVGLLDWNKDGLPDLVLAGGGKFEGNQIRGLPCKLFRNLGGMRFEEASSAIRLDGDWFYNHGIAVCDYDADGFDDLLITGWNRVALLHNEPLDRADINSPRVLIDVTTKAGVSVPTWSSSAAWGDIDGDGYPDLYVCCYVDWSFAKHPHCTYGAKVPDVCPPKEFKGLTHHLFLNQGDGSFKDVSKEALLEIGSSDSSKGLGVLMADFDMDGKPDIYVCNDTVENFLYLNKSNPGKVKLSSWARESGCARDNHGNPNGSMGVDASDYDRVGRPSIWVTNYENEPHALYHNDWKPGNLMFSWKTNSSGIAAFGQKNVSWGTGFGDFDRDGYEDIFVVNGHAIRYPGGTDKGQRMRPILMRNLGNGKFERATDRGGKFFQEEHRSRGAILADLDNDGALDLVSSQINEPVMVSRGVAPVDTHWIGFHLRRAGNKDFVGTSASIHFHDGRITRFAKGGGSYASSPDRRLHFGLGAMMGTVTAEIAWPDGMKETFEGLKIDRYHDIVQGNGKKPK